MTFCFDRKDQNSFYQQINRMGPAVFVTLWMLWTAISLQAAVPTCRSLIQHSQLVFDEKKSLGLVARLDRETALAAEALLVSVQAESELARLKKLYLFLRKQESIWASSQMTKRREEKYIKAAAKPGFEFIRKGDAEDIALYRRNEINDILYRIEDRIADLYAEELVKENAIESTDTNLAIVALALREYNQLSFAGSYAVEEALSDYRLFSRKQATGIIKTYSATDNADRGWSLDAKRRSFLVSLGLDSSEAIGLNAVLKKGTNKNRCCLNSCRNCTKHRSLKNALTGN